jgi:hypothetical protein
MYEYIYDFKLSRSLDAVKFCLAITHVNMKLSTSRRWCRSVSQEADAKSVAAEVSRQTIFETSVTKPIFTWPFVREDFVAR